MLWIGQEQEGWVTKPMVEHVAGLLSMPFIRVLEVATFYTMFNLHPVGDLPGAGLHDDAVLAARLRRRRRGLQEAYR